MSSKDVPQLRMHMRPSEVYAEALTSLPTPDQSTADNTAAKSTEAEGQEKGQGQECKVEENKVESGSGDSNNNVTIKSKLLKA